MGDNVDDDILNDLNDLESDDDIEYDGGQQTEQEVEQQEGEEDGIKNQQIKETIDEMKQEFQQQAREVSYLPKDKDFLAYMTKLKLFVVQKPAGVINVDHEEYTMIKKGNEYGAIIDREIQAVHKFVKDQYHKKFAELEKVVLNPVEYVKCVKLVQNRDDYNQIDFAGLLTSHQILAITVAGSSSIGQQLSQSELKAILNACEVILELVDLQKLVLLYVETRMHFVAPNLSQLVGTQCASKLMSASGGIEALSKMPACNIQVMGSQKKALLGFSKAGQGFNRGYFGQLDFVQKAPPLFQTRLVRMLSTNVAKCCRIDSARTCFDGSAGKRIKELMLQRFDKIQEPPEGKLDKPIPVPDDKPKKKRGGKRFRKMKERLEVTEVRKNQGRLTFGEEGEQDYRGTGYGFGQLTNTKGQSSGKVRTTINKNQKLKLSKKQQQKMVQQNIASSKDSGITSSIAFTPVQGVELVNPQKKFERGPDNYFNKESGFRTVTAQNEKKRSLMSMLGPMSNNKM